MISVVICSVKSHLAGQIKSNIDNSIGVPWEAIIIDNTSPSRSITAVYNEGARKAVFPILCFVHEDVAFLTKDWGKKLTGYFSDDPKLGMVGVAGAAYKSRTVSGWMTSISDFDRYNITHRDPDGKNERMFFDQAPASALKEVVTLDGVLLCARKSVISEIAFDEELLTGFHLYDIDISWRISRVHKIAVSFEIDLLHFTEGGDFGDRWVMNTLKWHKRYASQLPVIKSPVPASKKHERQVALFYLKRLRTEKISASNKIKWVRQSGSLRDLSLWSYIVLFFIYKPLKPLIRKLK
jgi:hypothetical protein